LTIRRLLPYVLGLVVLAFALGSLPRGTPGGSLLFRSYWLLYLLYLGPVVILGAMVAIIILIGISYRDIGAAIGFGMAQRRKARKPRSRYTIFLQMIFWALAIGVLIETKGNILSPTHGANSTIASNIVGEPATAPSLLKTGGFLPALTNLVQNIWFSLAFLGLLIVGGVVLIESYRVSLKETRDLRILELQSHQEQGLQAVQEAINLVRDAASDPRSRIIACYQHLIATVSKLGAPVSSDLTARELDRAVRSTLALKGSSITDLTQLFEEARYSLHEIGDNDADKAREDLESVAEELKIQLQSEN
jgi:Domain of unknown function (DUF4129)